MKYTLRSTAYRSTGFVIALLLTMFASPQRSSGQLSLTSGATVTINLDNLGTSASTTTTLASLGIRGGNTVATYAAAGTTTTQVAGTSGTGALASGSAGGFYNFANGITASSTDRALGFLFSSGYTSPGFVYLAVTNNTGGAITGFNLSFDYEKYRTGTNANGSILGLQVSSDDATYTNVAAARSVFAGSEAANNVVNPPTTTSKSVTISGLAIAPGSTYYFRWYDTVSGNTNSQAFGIDNIVFTPTIATPTHYYIGSTGALDDPLAWWTSPAGTGSHPANFTGIAQIFHITNGNGSTATVSGSAWTVSGAASRIVVDGSDLTITTKPIVGNISVYSGRTLTLSTSTVPTIDSVYSGSTIAYTNGVANTLYYYNTYGSILLSGSGTSITNPGSKSRLAFAGNLTVSNSATFAANNITLLPKSSAAQTISGNNNTFTVDSIVSIAANKTGTLTLASSTPMTISGSIVINNSGSSNAFSDGGNTLNVVGVVSMTGDAAGYVLTGTINAIPTSATNFFGAATTNPVIAALKNVTVSTTSPVTFMPTAISAATTTISGSLTVNAASTVTLGANTIALGGNFTWTPSGGTLNASNTSLIFNGSGAQSYSTGIAAANHIFSVTTLNNTGSGLTINSKIQTPSFVWTAGTLLAVPGTSSTAGPTYSVTGVFSGAATKNFLGGGTWNGTSGLNGGILRITGTGSTATNGITIGNTTGTYSSGVLDLASATAWNNTSGNDITVNPYSQLFISTAPTGALSAVNISISGSGNNISTYGPGALRTTAAAMTLSGPITLSNAIVPTATIYNGAALSLTGVISGGGGMIKSGTATALTLTGANTYSGGTEINIGTILANSSSALGSGSLFFNQKGSGITTGVTINNSHTIGSLKSAFDAPTTAVTQTLTIAAGQTLTITQSSNETFGNGANGTQKSVLSAGSTASTLVKDGNSDITFGSGNYSYSGKFTVNAGRLILAPASSTTLTVGALAINGGSLLITPATGVTTITATTLTFNGGALSTNGITASGAVITGGTVTLLANATITLDGSTPHTLQFAASNTAAWGANTLTIRGWQGDYVGGSAVAGKLVFLTGASTTIGATNLSKISFVDGSGISYPATVLSGGEIVPKAAITTGTVTYTPPLYNDVTNNISVAYTYTGPVPTAVNVELSDNTGSFTSPTVIGTGSSSPVAATIPSAVAVGAYKVRVVETAPLAVTGSSSASFNVIGHPPIIYSVSSYSATVGSTITITGTNFNTTPSNTKVFFGPIGVTPSSATFTTLTAVVPAGAAADFLTVTDNVTKLSANSTIKFFPDYVNDYFTTTLTMQGPTSYSINYGGSNDKWPWNTATGDLDGDGKQDIVVTTGYFDGSNSYSYISIFKNNTTNGSTDISGSSFTHVLTKQIQGLSSSVKIADLDGDGKPDIAAAGGSGSTVVNLLHNTTTGYGSGGTISVQAATAQINFGVIGPRVINIADFDQDGKLDIAAACFGTSAIFPPAFEYDTLVILTNATSVGSDFNSSSFTYSKFGAVANESGGTSGGTSLATADFDSDGDIDVALIDQRAFGHTSKITLFSNTSTAGSVQFTRIDTINAGSVTQDIVAADFNMDGKPDFAIANQYGGDIVAYTNGGSFSFGTTYTLPGTTGWAPAALTSADMNGDGKPDIITVNANSLAAVTDTVAVFLNTSTPGGAISFANPSVYHNGSNFSSAGVVVADLDQDKYPDIIVSNLLSDQISILRNKPHVNMGAVTGTTTVCHGSTTTLGYSAAGTTSPSGVTPAYSSSPLPSDITYGWISTDESVATINNTTGALNAIGNGAVSALYILNVAGTNIADTIAQPVNITYVNVTPGLDPNACQGDTMTLLPYSGEVGSPVTYSLAFDVTGLGEGFTNVTNNTLSGGTIAITVPGTAAFNTYPASLTVSDGTCVSDPIAINVNLNERPTGTVTASADSLCVNRDALITFASTAFSTVTYKIDAGSTTTLVADGSGIATLSVPHLDATHDYILVSANNGFCTANFTDTVHIKAINEIWTGVTSTDWNTASNWGCAVVPTDSDYVTVPVTANQPDLAAAATATSLNLTIASGASITLNTSAVLNVKGNLDNSGNVLGSGMISLNGTSAQQISGIGTVKNIELNNTAGATINTGSRLVVGSTLTVTAGTLTTNDSLELYSDVSGTARVAEIPASGAAIAGNVKVDQYIQANYRRYRFWAHPFSSAISLGQLQPYMDITGPGGTTNGFTTTGTNAPSAFKLVVAYSNPGASYDPGWVPITQINGAENDSNKLHQYQGLRLFMRGTKGQGLGGFPYVPSANTVSMKGSLNQGDQIIPLVKGTSIQDYNFIGNPYASPVDIGTALKLASDTGYLVGTAFYVWNTTLGAGGQYQAIDFVLGGVVQPYSLPACASFQVRAAYNGAHISVKESMKTATATSYLFKVPATPYVSLHIYDESYHPWDMLDIRFNDNATDAEDAKYDAVKPAGGDLSLYSLSADGRRMVIDARPFQSGKVVPLGITSTYKQNFIIRAENIAAPENGIVVLHDKLLNKYVELNAGTEYKFAINEDKATQGDNRFELSLKPAAVAAKFNVILTPNPATDDVKVTFSTPDANNVSVKVTDISGICVYSHDLGTLQAGQVTIPVARFAAGIYMVELTSGSNRSVQKLVKE